MRGVALSGKLQHNASLNTFLIKELSRPEKFKMEMRLSNNNAFVDDSLMYDVIEETKKKKIKKK